MKLKCKSMVLKVASRCNLNCTYCYMYNQGDDSYLDQPKFMSEDTVDAIIEKTKAHCLEHHIVEFTFVFHGGEPLLAGIDFFRSFIQKANDTLLPDVVPLFALQTNGVLLNLQWLNFFESECINLGISLDGNKAIHDLYRVFHNGNGSFDTIISNLNSLDEFSTLKHKTAILSVVNIEASPKELIAFYGTLPVENIDLLLPDSNYKKLPPNKESFNDIKYGKWLVEVFEYWYNSGCKKSIRLFTNIIANILGINHSTDGLGEGLNEILVIETDGGIEAVDVLKICGSNFTKENLNINRNTLDEALAAPLISKYIFSHTNLPDKCCNCSLNTICGGGYIPHRYSGTLEFNNPSIYCKDLAYLITHIQNRVLDDMPNDLLNDSGLMKFTYDQWLTENHFVYEQ